MIESIIRWSVGNRFFVLLATFVVVAMGIYSLKNTPVDAIPDLSDVQVIIKTSYPGQAPQVVEDQVTYPLTTAMLSVPGAVTVRGFSFFGDSYVYVIFDEDTDLYWARSRVLEYLSQVAPSLPENARPQLGPDATGVGWVYLYALVDRTGQHDISQLRSLQDWFLKYELQTVPGVSEVAAIGGMVKQYQVTVNPEKLRAFNMPLSHIQTAIKRANQEVGASVIEMAEAEYMVRAHLAVRNFKRVTLVARNHLKVVALQSCLEQLYPDVEFVIGQSTQEVIYSADVISCATGSQVPLFDGNWLKSGTHVDLIGNHQSDHRECDTATITRSRVYVDSKTNVLGEAGELLIPISEGVFCEQSVCAELADLAKVNTVARFNETDITVFKSVGTALSDLIAANQVYQSLQN